VSAVLCLWPCSGGTDMHVPTAEAHAGRDQGRAEQSASVRRHRLPRGALSRHWFWRVRSLYGRVYQVLRKRGLKMTKHLHEYLGNTVLGVMAHLERLFHLYRACPGGTSTLWHINHKIAIAKSKLASLKELLKSFKIRNLQPMWVKGAK
jgi:hypothetical protein